ncbi:hypothetical protein CW354_08055 [Marinicaulis flavus]|uniref:Uncharacterized protein n=1 Tax=Hyphococcus luteus TaxID=2058213 RepID=A0A2S7K6X1_9PROT|nr:hypothetical protein CW354_08055 [Marinicaulis flavus]
MHAPPVVGVYKCRFEWLKDVYDLIGIIDGQVFAHKFDWPCVEVLVKLFISCRLSAACFCSLPAIRASSARGTDGDYAGAQKTVNKLLRG